MPTSITIASGKFAVYRTDDTSGAIPYVNILAAADGAACILSTFTGKVFVFRINAGKVQVKISTDTIGTVWGAWIDVVASLVKDGVPSAEQLATGRILVCYFKTDDKWYQSYTDNQTDWIEVEITT
jgi:hypothetical protein